MLLSLVAEGCRPEASIHTLFPNRVICYNLWFQSNLDPPMFLAAQNLISPTHQTHTGIHCRRSTSAVSEAADFHERSHSADHEPHCISRPLLFLFLHLTICLLTRPPVSLSLIPCSLPATTCSPFTLPHLSVSSTKHSKHLKLPELRILYSTIIQSVLLTQTL